MFSLMANCFSWVKKRREPWKKVTLLMVGLDNAGKTCTVADLKGDTTDGITPTVGFLTSSFTLFRYHVTMLDLGGGPKIRAVWKNYFAESFGIVFVVDSSDVRRLQESKTILHETFDSPLLSGKSLLVLANKQDIEGALDEHQIYEQLSLDELKEKHKCSCQVFTCTAVLGNGNKVDRQIKKGFQWLLSEISDEFSSLSERVDREYGEQKRLEAEDRARRREAVRKIREEREKAEQEAERRQQEADEESDEGVIVGTDKKKKKETASEPETPEKMKKKKKKKKKKKSKIEEDEDEDEDVGVVTSKMSGSIPNGKHKIRHTTREDDESNEEDNREAIQASESLSAVGEDGEGKKKKKKKKKKRRQNKTAPAADDEGDGYELPPLAWGSPSNSMNGFPGKSALKSRRLEPIGRGSSNFSVPTIPEDEDNTSALPPLRGKSSWARTRPNSEDQDLMT